jgi:hypothetical protein
MDFPYDQPLEDEKPRPFTWFMRYRDMEPPRSIEKLHRSCTETAPKKGISLRSLKQYSVDFHWQRRCEAYDTQIAKEAAGALMEKRQSELDAFIDQDFSIATRMQGLVDKKLEALEKVEGVDVKELRTLAAAYKESRVWVQELLGLLEDERERSNEKA